jgi:hypothetical protein
LLFFMKNSIYSSNDCKPDEDLTESCTNLEARSKNQVIARKSVKIILLL